MSLKIYFVFVYFPFTKEMLLREHFKKSKQNNMPHLVHLKSSIRLRLPC